MKKLSLIIIISMMMYSCNNEVILKNKDIQFQETEAEKASNNVTLDDIQAYMQQYSKIASRNSKSGTIEVITHQNDTVMYLLNYENGWEMMPSDKRFPLRVAYNNEGKLDYSNMHNAQRAWFKSMAEDIYLMKKHGKNIKNDFQKEWDQYLKRKNNKIFSSRSTSEDEIEESGGWLLHNTRVQENVLEKEHLLSTCWEQSSYRDLFELPDYNMYCPLTSTKDKHCPTGCTAVAGGQILYYFHQLWGVPTNMVTTAIYDETENEFNFSGWSNSGWSKIDNGDIESIALLLGHVGVLCGMTYGDEASSASTYNDLPDALSFYGIGCSRMESWDTSIIINNLSSNKPIIGRIQGIGENGKTAKHSLIIDGYKKINSTYTDVYIYVEDYNSYPGDIYDHDENENPVPEEGPTREETYTISTTYYMINWGYGEVDNTFYLSNNPIHYTYDDEYGKVPYKDNKKMLYNFHIE